jgi:soluble P-type ATPase
MVTCGQVAIARKSSRQLGLGTNIVKASALGDTKLQPSSQIIQAIKQSAEFAEVFPWHKYFIIEALQKNGHIVGMTGDGVNDAPALKKADYGIAVADATEAARAAASIVLLAPGLSIIIDAFKRESQDIPTNEFPHVPEAVYGWTSDDLPHTHERSILVDQAGEASLVGCAWNTDRRDLHRRLWPLYEAAALEICGSRLGLRHSLGIAD